MRFFAKIYQRILGHPFVYNHIRPLLVGGQDFSNFYGKLADERRILDVGCGTGDALRYLNDFESYVGFDTDPVAIRFARQANGHRPGVRFECRRFDRRDAAELAPTAVILAGVLHHLADADARELLETLLVSAPLRRVITIDLVHVRGMPYNSLLAYLDRGRHTRTAAGYEALVRTAGLRIEKCEFMPPNSRNKHVLYFGMTLAPATT
jgi:SAM-dependent methyltransferase